MKRKEEASKQKLLKMNYDISVLETILEKINLCDFWRKVFEIVFSQKRLLLRLKKNRFGVHTFPANNFQFNFWSIAPLISKPICDTCVSLGFENYSLCFNLPHTKVSGISKQTILNKWLWSVFFSFIKIGNFWFPRYTKRVVTKTFICCWHLRLILARKNWVLSIFLLKKHGAAPKLFYCFCVQ